MNGFWQNAFLVERSRVLIEMNDQREGPVGAHILSPLYDVFLGSRIEISLPERRRIHRVEELSRFGKAQVEHCTVGRECGCATVVAHAGEEAGGVGASSRPRNQVT